MLPAIAFCLAFLTHGLDCKQPAFMAELTKNPHFQEVLFALFIVFLIYYYIQGKAANKRIAWQVFDQLKGLIAGNFAYVGTKHLPTETALAADSREPFDNPAILEQDSPNSFRVYLTGRESVKFAILNMILDRRHDFISATLYAIFWPEKDKIQIEVALADSCIGKGVCYAVRSKHAKKAIEDYEDLRHLTKRLKPDDLTRETVAVFGETDEIVGIIFDKTFSALLDGSAGDLLEAIEITDCVASEFHKGSNAKLILNLGRKRAEDFAQIERLTDAFFKALDRIADYIPSARVREELEENRKKYNALKDKLKKAEAGLGPKSLDERLAAMSPAERKKFEEKEQRKMQQKKKMVKLVKGA